MLKKLSLVLFMLICSGFLLLSCSDDSSTEPVVNSTLTCKITSPLTNTSFGIGSAISITADASDANSSVKEVAFYINNTIINRDTIAPYQFSWNTSGLDSINYQIKAVARNSKGETCSNEITVKLNTPPFIADFVVSQNSGNLFTEFAYDASGCSDPYDNDSLLRVRWDFDGNGTFDTDWSTTKTVTHQFAASGSYWTELQLKNTRGMVTSRSKPVTVGAPINVYSQNFDNLITYQGIVEQNVANWLKWSPQADDGLVTDINYFSESNSLRVQGTTDVLYNLGNKTGGKYKIGFKMYVPTGYVGYFNLMHNFDADSSDNNRYAVQVYLSSTGGRLEVKSSTTSFNYDHSSWLDFAIYVDQVNDVAKLTLNGLLIKQWPWSTSCNSDIILNKLSAIDFFAYGASGNTEVPKYYIDDFSVMQIE